MNSNFVYIKTAAGEAAIQQRTRVIQRNVRMVLILVDGQSTIADLTRKIGNPQLVENALLELERGGFIEPKLEQVDSLWEEGKKVEQEIRAAVQERSPRSPDVRSEGSATSLELPRIDVTQPGDWRKAARNEPTSAQDIPMSLHSVFDDRSKAASVDASPLPSHPGTQPSILDPGRAGGSASPLRAQSWPESSSRRSMVMDESGISPSTRSSVFPVTAGRRYDGGGRHAASREEKNENPPGVGNRSRQGGRRHLGWFAWTAIGLVVIVGLGLLGFLLLPTNAYKQDIETAMSQAVGQPVRIERLGLLATPIPSLALEGVSIGQGGRAVRVREIRLVPVWSSLLGQDKRFQRAVVSGAVLSLDATAGLPHLLAALSRGQSALRVPEFRLEDTELSFGGLQLARASAVARRGSDGRMQALDVRSEDGGLSFSLAPAGDALALTVEAVGWRPAEGGRLVVDSASFSGRIEQDRLTINALEMRVFDGLVRGDALVRGGQGKPNLSGALAFERINAAKLSEALGANKRLTGDIAGSLRFSSVAEVWPSLIDGLSGDGEFAMQRGNISGFDLVEAARRVSAAPVQGGVTAFEQLSGRFRLLPERTQFQAVVINSGLMQSLGSFEIAGGGKLSGRFELRMKGSVNQTQVPVILSGSLESPAVQVAAR